VTFVRQRRITLVLGVRADLVLTDLSLRAASVLKKNSGALKPLFSQVSWAAFASQFWSWRSRGRRRERAHTGAGGSAVRASVAYYSFSSRCRRGTFRHWLIVVGVALLVAA